ncbi:NAD(P)/FAD-dependent oxidoreductase [Acidocella sp.]|uniref:NAD(P)/FAD-dependent oxidoreductase n=1 Tax=Acidocella sp. TaxID=50710 RepID=UPI0026345DF9|nr:NAD(P)/FAD-dependent oxidoreductase [Acidocella sp.]MDD2794475.1 NAD(P)/FAD-dependent oxidoreductase [Acidocella sp.]
MAIYPKRITGLRLNLNHDETQLRAAVCAAFGVADAQLLGMQVFRRAFDARKKSGITLVYTIDAELSVPVAYGEPVPDVAYKFVTQAKAPPARRPVVIGTGPCGIFAALVLAQMGFAPIILERGKVVRQRTKDTWGLWRRGVLNPESNVQFGEGGAGTFSDGKLYSQIKDPRHLGRKVLTEFVKAGAPEEILYVAKPHIGTFRLVGMVETMRAGIEALGGEYRFGCKVTDIEITEGQVRAVVLESGERIETGHVVLAVGHSARDTFAMLHQRGVFMEAKPFSVGFRIEHPQSMIDQHRFGAFAGNPILGAADYKLVHHAGNGRSVYSFCMCPGGTVVAATSEPGRVVTNGMSQYSRNERNANAGIVVGITPADYPGDVLAGVEFQRRWESAAYAAGGGTYAAPGQLVGDFIAGRASTAFGEVLPSYKPGVHLTDLAPTLPDYAIAAIREALPAFEKQIRGFSRPDAVLTGVETRTSSPVRITRGQDFCSLSTRGLYPAGEGAGYAGGILSAGVDGIKVAEAVGLSLTGG